MNFCIIGRLIGNVLKYQAVFMGIAASVSLIYKEETVFCFLASIAVMLLIGVPLSEIKYTGGKFHLKDSYVAVALSWFTLALFGALPFYFSGYFKSFMDCFFESTSGFTTTGATILTDIESLPRGLQFWRCFAQWIGGMGVLVFMLTIMPMNASYFNIMKAESPGPTPGKIVPKLKETARIFYLLYIGMTVVLVILQCALGMPLFDSFIHAFSTAGTGGFSNKNLSIGAYNDVSQEIITSVFMLLFGVSFTLYYHLSKKDIKGVFKDEELRLYFGTALAAMVLVTIDLTKIHGSVWQAVRHSVFQVSSIVTTTGYSTADYELWPTFSKLILVLLMLMGSCAGSTGGGLKMIRVLVLLKSVKIELSRLIHPRGVKTVKVNGKSIEKEVLRQIYLFFFVYMLILMLASVALSFEEKDLITTVSAAVATLSNIGPGLGIVGPLGSFAFFSPFSKTVLSLCMIAGRLEILPLLVLFTPPVWRDSGR